MIGAARRVMVSAVLAVGLVAPLVGSAVAAPVPPPVGVEPFVDRDATGVVSTLVGTGAPGETGQRYAVEGTDLGHTFLHRGRLAAVFGDTFGAPPADPFFSVAHRDWRSNVLGWIDPHRRPRAGTAMAEMISERPGYAKELLPSRKQRGVEQTVIPTYGISTGARMWLHSMSVRSFDTPGRWTLNGAGLSYSDDDGRTWTRAEGAQWPGASRFGQVAYVRPAAGGTGERTGPVTGPDDTTYVYGIPGGRYGAVSLARVPTARLGDRAAYEYRTADGWSRDEAAATDVLPGPVGELSVRYHSFYKRWMMMYLVDPTGEIVLRTADAPTGPWSEPQVVTTTKDYSEAYAPYLTPVWNDGPDVVFTMSRYSTYRVYLMRTQMSLLPAGSPLPLELRTTPPERAAPRPLLRYPFEHGIGSLGG